MLVRVVPYVELQRFQSAPAIAGGRCDACSEADPPTGRFQSAPAIAGGRCWRGRGSGLLGDRVSIRARHCWRAMRKSLGMPSGICCFNPRPPLLAGDARGRPSALPSIRVSIRARHCWRAMRRSRVMSASTAVFQSAPAIAGGRCACAALTIRPSRCFNPRPPLLAGDAHADFARAGAGGVSIRARHCWRAMHQGGVTMALVRVFQSAPAIAGGRCRPNGLDQRPARCFNPRPPLLAGDASRSRATSSGMNVSIRARHCWRAMRTRR